MARLSVYIPDELLEEARAVGSQAGSDTAENTSQLIQQGLRGLIEQSEHEPGYAQRPENGAELIAKVRDRLLAEAREKYEHGYITALEAASLMSLHPVNELANAHFDLERWIKMYRESYEWHLANRIDSGDTFRWVHIAAKALGDWADQIHEDHSFTPTTAAQRGFSDAMRELWASLEDASLESPTQDTSPESSPDVDASHEPGREAKSRTNKRSQD
jgi:hypothetical protein